MAFWDIDLTTRAGAIGAAQTGATASFVYAAASFGGLVMSGALLNGMEAVNRGAIALSVVLIAVIEIGVGLIAGWRLGNGKGAYWGMAAAAVIVLDIVAHVLSMMGLVGLVLCIVVLVFVINGVRGALALKNRASFEDDDIEAFS